MSAIELRRILWEALDALRPYADELTLVGGWVPYLYHIVAEPSPLESPLQTFDVDLVAGRLEARGDRATLADLLERRGFQEDLAPVVGTSLPKVRFARTLADGTIVHVEFLVPARAGRRPSLAPLPEQQGLTAEALPYLDILVEHASTFRISPPEGANGSPVTVQAPRPAAFVFVKLLTWRRRTTRDARGKDLYYVFELVDRYPAVRTRVEEELPQLARANSSLKAEICSQTHALAEADGDGALLAARIAEQRYAAPAAELRRRVARRFKNILQHLGC